MFKSILMPVDGSTLSYKPMQVATDLAKLSSGKLIVMSVAEPRLFNGSDADSLQTGQTVEEMRLHAAKVNVQKVLDYAEEANVDCEAVVSMSRLPDEEILEAAKQYHCDVIVMATRGKTGVIDMMFNESLTQEVLRKSMVPVLVFP
ncbi:MAG TPA: universal stress protein [Noviherbaspirillum sp.]|jgi:nucleotide-binding universal stress UspA family protein|uniref:universal stress protein n=1 Tax=Noviherbaspirillum sp. TaxID=1926288 RepID=UPI002DDCE781|nr:universal stress protein [Noviherbaspirillum sp.]HEV2612619.1 universal stress protein [Noviherbaspirillum sp.]